MNEGKFRLAKWERWLLVAILVVGAILRLAKPGLAYFSLHVDRDLYRAMQLLRMDEFPLLGSEMQYGGRVFGPLVYFIYAIPLAVWESPLGVSLFIGAVNLGVVFWTWAFTRRWFGAIAAAVAAVLYTVSPLEIIQLRYLWNPCFLPLMVLGMYSSLYNYIFMDKNWQLVILTLFLSFGIQLHFSMFMTLPILATGFLMVRRAPRAGSVIASIALVFLLFAPMIINELKPNDEANIKKVFEVPDAQPSVWDRHKPNPNAWINFLHVVTFDPWENPNRLGFTYLWNVGRQSFGNGIKPVPVIWAMAAVLQFSLFLAGVIFAIQLAREHCRTRTLLGADARSAEWKRVVAHLLLVGWVFAPLLFLSFFSYHKTMDPTYGVLIPIRYYLISFPAQFILAGVGASWLVPLLRSRLSQTIAGIAAGTTVVAHIGFCCVHLAILSATGVALPYLVYDAPTLDSMIEVREVLLDRFKINAEDYYSHVATQNVLFPWAGETTMDWLITQDVRSQRNPGLPPGQSIVVFRQVNGEASLDPAKQLTAPAGAKVLDQVQTKVALVILYDRPLDPSIPALDPKEKRNYYYKEVRMKYLGREKP